MDELEQMTALLFHLPDSFCVSEPLYLEDSA